MKSVENAIIESNLGINPQIDGQLIRLPIPKLSEERRKELSKLVSQYGEQAKVAIRNNRREILDKVKKDEKDKVISQDESKKITSDVQKITDEQLKPFADVPKRKSPLYGLPKLKRYVYGLRWSLARAQSVEKITTDLYEAKPADVVFSYFQCTDSLLHRFWIFQMEGF